MKRQPIDYRHVVVVLLCALTLFISHGYRGIVHDARLYTMQALARISPDSFSADVFLQFGSQDHFTVFSPIYAAAIRLFGLESSAAFLTLAFQLTLIAGAWILARTVMPVGKALFGLAIFVAIPGEYGASRVFTYMEAFVTPRMAAEALVLIGISFVMKDRRVLGLSALLAAASLHPIMAAPGIVAAVFWRIGPLQSKVGAGLIALGFVVLSAGAAVMPTGVFARFDTAWLDLVVDRSPYLFLSSWNLNDWGRVIVTMTTLLIGALAMRSSPSQRLCWVAFATVACGLALTLVACDFLHLVLFTQLQPWRWQWFGTVVAALILPVVFTCLWESGTIGRATALSLCSALILETDEPAMIACSVAVICQMLSSRFPIRYARLFLFGGLALFALAVSWRVASDLQFTDSHFLNSRSPVWLRQMISFCHDGFIPVVVIAISWWLMQRFNRMPALLASGLLAATTLLVAPALLRQWTLRDFPRSTIDSYEAWRREIPVRAQVYCPDSPTSVWYLLQRASYISTIQSAGVLFSRDAAIEMQRRAKALNDFIPASSIMGWDRGEQAYSKSPESLQAICDLHVFDFIVTRSVLNREPAATQPGKSPRDPTALKLYQCAAQARAAAAAT
jgi:hypothetical protein